MARIGRFVGVLEGDLALLGGELYHCVNSRAELGDRLRELIVNIPEPELDKG